MEKELRQTIEDLKSQLIAARTTIERLESAQSRQKEPYQTIFENSQLVILLIDPDTGRIIDANRAALRFYGHDKPTMLSKSIQQINALPEEAVRKEMQRARRQQRQIFRFRHELANGEVRDVEMFSRPVEIGEQTLLYSVVHDVTVRDAEEEQLRLLWHAVNQSTSSVIITDRDGHIEYVNPYFTQLTGYSLVEVLGKTPRILKSGHTSRAEYEEMWATLVSGNEWTGEFHNKKKNGEPFWEEANISPVRDLHGEITHFVAVKKDITEAKKSRRELEWSEFTLRRSQSIARVGDWTWDTHTNTVRWSEEMYSIFGVDRETAFGDLNDIIEQAIHPDDREAVYAANRSVIDEGKPAGMEYRILRPDGSVRHVWAQPGVEERDAEGNIIFLSGTVQDITARKQIEIRLREAEQFSRSTVNALSAHVAIVDEDGTILAVNDAWREFAAANGADADAVLEGVNYFAVIEQARGTAEEASAVQFGRGLRQILAGSLDFYLQEYPCHAPDTQRWFVGRITPFRQDDGEHGHKAVVTHENITERVLAEREVAEHNRELQFMNAIISAATDSSDTTILLEHACEEIAAYLSVPRVLVLEFDETTSRARLVAGFLPAAERNHIGLEFSPPAAPGARELSASEALRATAAALPGPNGTEQVLCLPLEVPSDPARALCVYLDAAAPLSGRKEATLARAMQALIHGLEKSRLHQRLARYNADLEMAVARQTRELRQLNSRLESILNTTSDAILLLSEDGRLERANTAFEQTFGYTSRTTPGNIWDIIERSDREALHGLLATALQETGTMPMSARGVRSDGALIDIELILSPVLNNENHLVCTIHDMTHFKSVERLKDQFVSTVNHELRNPIAGIVLASDVLHKYYDKQSDEQRRRRIGQIRQQAHSLTELVNAVLDMARIDERREVPQGQRVNMSDLVHEVVTQMEEKARIKKQILNLALPEDPPFATVEWTDFTRIWGNLIDNAIKYTPEEGRIDVRLAITNGQESASNALPLPAALRTSFNGRSYFVGQVEDTGYGMNSEDQAQLFTRFFRGWAERSDIPGTGLGLVLVRELLQLYRGDIDVMSEPGVGTVFTFWIPLGIEEEKQ